VRYRGFVPGLPLPFAVAGVGGGLEHVSRAGLQFPYNIVEGLVDGQSQIFVGLVGSMIETLSNFGK
jgi:hypothetical protein